MSAHPTSAGDSAAYERRNLACDDVVIVSACRTALCKAKRGGFKDTPVDDLIATVLKETIRRSGVEPEVGARERAAAAAAEAVVRCWGAAAGRPDGSRNAGLLACRQRRVVRAASSPWPPGAAHVSLPAASAGNQASPPHPPLHPPACPVLPPCLQAVGDVCFGSVMGPSSQRANECRIAMFLAGFPTSVPVHTVNRQCSSGAAQGLVGMRTWQRSTVQGLGTRRLPLSRHPPAASPPACPPSPAPA